jgi:hypothetical protein
LAIFSDISSRGGIVKYATKLPKGRRKFTMKESA